MEYNAAPMHVTLIAPCNEDSTNIKPLWAATLAAHGPQRAEFVFERRDAFNGPFAPQRASAAGAARHRHLARELAAFDDEPDFAARAAPPRGAADPGGSHYCSRQDRERARCP